MPATVWSWRGAPDVALVDACLDGDEGAWEALVRRYGRLVHAIGLRSRLDLDEAADLSQTVFTIVYRNLSLLDEPAALAGWIGTIARREVWRAVRHRSRRLDREGTPLDEAPEPALGSPPVAHKELEQVERAFLVERGLAKVDERCRRLLHSLFWEAPTPSYEKISDRLEIPIGGIGPTRARCLTKLRRALERLGP